MLGQENPSHFRIFDPLRIFIKIATGHLLASPRRTILTVSLSLVTTTILVFVYSIMNGSHHKLKRDSVEIYTGYLRVQGEGFQKSKNPFNWLINPDAVIAKIHSSFGQVPYTRRLESFGLFSNKEETQGAMIVGIDPKTEPSFSRIIGNLSSGLSITTNTNQILIGQDFSDAMGLKTGDELAFVGQSLDGSIAAERFLVCGIFRTGLVEIDRNMIIADLNFLQGLLMAENIVSHIILHPDGTDEDQIQKTALEYEKKLKGLGAELIPWTEELSYLVQTLNFDRASGQFTLSILLTIIFFVLLIYAQMSILTRTREIGVMRALGTSPSRIFSILILENFLSGTIGCFLGALCGAGLAIYFQIYPMQFPSLEVAIRQYGLSDTSLPTLFKLSTMIQGFCIVLTMNLLSAVQPIIKVLKIKPVDALQSYA